MSSATASPRPLAGRLSACALSAVLALTGVTATATPARADDDLLKVLAAATAIAILYSATRSHRDDRGPRKCMGQRCYRPAPLPVRCQVEIRDRHHGRQLYYGQRCLHRAGIDTRRLPWWCEATLRTQNATRVLYRADCLAREGFGPRGKGRHW